jgi:predicted Zn-dependent protease
MPTPTNARMSMAAATPAPSTGRPATDETGETLAGTDIHIQVGPRDAGGGKGKAGEQDAEAAGIGQAFADVQAAQARQDHDAVSAGLARLAQLLPADSLTLLRTRAWVAHEDGELVEAQRLYEAVVGRVPNDRNASINLALLQAGRGELAQARARLERFALTNGDSPELARARSQIGGNRR